MIYAKYTEVLYNLLKNEQTKPLIDKAMSTYPMYKPESEIVYTIISNREQLNNKILNYYKYREIGFETVGRFIEELQTTMEEIMPYYYQLYKSADIMNGINDPFGNVDIVETFEEEREGSSKGLTSEETNNKTNTTSNTQANSTTDTTTNMTTDGKSVKSQTPQGQISIPSSNIDSVSYADEVTWDKSNSNSTGESNGESTTEATGTSTSTNLSSGNSETETSGKTKHTFTKVGNQGVNTYAHDMKELREIFLNIDQQIINDPRIAELFMTVY